MEANVSDSQELVDLKARVVALETLLKHVLWNVAVLVADRDGDDMATTVSDLQLFIGNLAQEMRTKTFPDLDPAMSDHLAQGAAGHVERVLSELVQAIEDEHPEARGRPDRR